MSNHGDNQNNFRRAQPIFMGLRVNRNGDIQNLITKNEKNFATQAKKALVPFVQQRYNMYRDFAVDEDPANAGQLITEPHIHNILTQHVYGDYTFEILNRRARNVFRHKKLGMESAFGGLENRPTLEFLENGLSYAIDRERGLMGAGQDNQGIYTASLQQEEDEPVTSVFGSIINNNAPEKIFFLPSFGTAVVDIALLTRAWPTALNEYFAGRRNNENSGRIPQLMRRILVDTDTDDDRKLGTNDRPLLRAPWFETHVGYDNDMINNIIEYAYSYDTEGSALYMFEEPMVENILNTEKSLFFFSWANSIIQTLYPPPPPPPPPPAPRPYDPYIEQRQTLARAAIQATFNSRNTLMSEDEIDGFYFDADGEELDPNSTEYTEVRIPRGYENRGMNYQGATLEFLNVLDSLFEETVSTDVGRRVSLNQESDMYRNLFFRENILGAPEEDFEENPYAWAAGEGYEGEPGFDVWVDYSELFPNGYAFIPDSTPEDNPDDTGWVITNQAAGRYVVQYSGYGFVNAEDAHESDRPIDIDLDNEVIYTIRGLRESDLIFPDEEEEEENRRDGFAVESQRELTGDNLDQLLFTRVMIDVYFEMEAHLSLVLNSNKINFNKFSKEYNQNTSSILQHEDERPFFTTNEKKQTPVADFLAEERATIMSGLAASMLALVGDRNFRKLYEQDLNLLEVKWYSDFISNRLLQAVPVEEEVNQLRQRTAIPAPLDPRVPENLQPLAMQVVQPTTLIRALDVPTLRLIMKTYFNRFYEEVARHAREIDAQPKKKNKKKKKPLFDQMWDTVEATIVTMLSLEKANPARYWRRTFAQVEESGRQNMQMILPPSWAGTISRVELESDKASIGLTPDIEKNVSLFKTYISFLRTTYRDDYGLIAGLLTAFQSTGSDSIRDITELQDFFAQRLKNDQAFRLNGRSIPAYRQFVYICRETLTIPSYVAAASLAMQRVEEDALSPAQSDARELEGGIMMGPSPTPFEAPLPNPSLLRPDGGSSQ